MVTGVSSGVVIASSTVTGASFTGATVIKSVATSEVLLSLSFTV